MKQLGKILTMLGVSAGLALSALPAAAAPDSKPHASQPRQAVKNVKKQKKQKAALKKKQGKKAGGKSVKRMKRAPSQPGR